MPATTDNSATRREILPVVLLAAAVVALAAYRASVGQSFYDDTFYAVVPWRFAHGARFLVDELSFQTPAEMISVPLVWLWERVFGDTGLVLAIRMLWVVLATGGAALAVRWLRNTTSRLIAVIAIAVPLLAPAYHVFAPTYNTISSLLFTLAVMAAFAAARDRSATMAAVSGGLVALGSAAYPPLAPAGGVLLLSLAIGVRSSRLTWPALAAAAGLGALLAAALLGGAPSGQIALALRFGSANVAQFATPLAKFSWVFDNTVHAFEDRWLWPMWLLALAACVPRVPGRLRAASLALVPLAAAAPSALLLAHGDTLTWGTSAQSWLTTACAALLVPCLLAARRASRADLLGFLALAAPFSAVGYVTVAYVTNSSWNRGMPFVALAPLATAILLAWATELASHDARMLWTGATLTMLVAFAILYSNVFGDSSFWQPQTRILSGAYAGLLTSPDHAADLQEIPAASARWIGGDSRVTFLGQAEAYLAVPGQPFTPAAWLFLGKADRTALDYFSEERATPDAILVDEPDVAFAGGYPRLLRGDPMIEWMSSRYRRATRAGDFTLFVRK